MQKHLFSQVSFGVEILKELHFYYFFIFLSWILKVLQTVHLRLNRKEMNFK